MPERLPLLLVKALTHSDCSYFEEYHRRTGMKQKAINLDQAKIKSLFPSLSDAKNTSRYPVTVDVFASGAPPTTVNQVISLSQKNWRLNGLLRGNLTVNPGDLLLAQILGSDALPADRLPAGVALAVVRPGDQGYEWLAEQCPQRGFATIDDNELLEQQWLPTSPVFELVDALTRDLRAIVADMVDEADEVSIPRLGLQSIDRTGTTRDAVERLNRLRSAIGLGGETLVDATLARMLDRSKILSYEWVSECNAMAPVDFHAGFTSGALSIEVKTTKGKHEKSFSISTSELREAQRSAPYEIWRVSQFDYSEDRIHGEIRRADPSILVNEVLAWLDTSPGGVRVTNVEVSTAALEWSEGEKASCAVDRVPSPHWADEYKLPTT